MGNFSEKQKEFIREANHRYNFKVGAVRSGKSYVDIRHTILERLDAVRDKKGLNVIMGVSRDTVERNVLQPMREQFGSRAIGVIKSTTNIAEIMGVPVYCLGAEKISQVAKIQGTSIKYCYGDEIAKWNKDVFYMLESRFDKPYSRMDGALNPESPNHWLKQWMEKPNIDVYTQHYTIFDNPFLPDDFVKNLCNEYEGTVYYGRYIQGEWTLAEGLIYPHYEEIIKEAPKDAEATDYVLSIDYGTMNAFSCGLWAKYGRRWHRMAEYYYSGRDTGVQKTDGEYLADLENMLNSSLPQDLREMRIRTIIDPSAASMIALLKRSGRFKVKEADNSVLEGIQNTNTAMHDGLISVSPKCENWIREAQGYVWDEKATEDKPTKVNDHAMDDTRYFVQTMKLTRPKTEYKPIYM